ncbi:hypothetical protein [Treponema sp. R80B11-R83G3]
MTEKEAEDLDDYFTKNTIMPNLNKPGYFARKYGMAVTLDPETTKTLTNYAENVHKTPAVIIAEMVRERIAAAV